MSIRTITAHKKKKVCGKPVSMPAVADLEFDN
jgi:hypothetical protein